MKKIIAVVVKRKFTVAILSLIVLGGGYYAYESYRAVHTSPQYITSLVERGTLTVSVSGSGQVSGSSQLDIKPEVASKVVKLLVLEGQEITANAPLTQLDASEADKILRDARVNLDSVRLALQKLQQPADALSLLQTENVLASVQTSLAKLKLSQVTDYQNAEDAKQKALASIDAGYEDTFSDISNSFLDFPAIISALDTILHGDSIGKVDPAIGKGYVNTATLLNTTKSDDDRQKLQLLITSAEHDYQLARIDYDANLVDYKAASRFSDRSVIDVLSTKTIETAKRITEATKSQTTLLDAWVDLRTQRNAVDYLPAASKVAEHRSSLNTYLGQANGHLSTLLSAQQSLKDSKDTAAGAASTLQQMDHNNPLDLAAAEQSVKEKQASLDKLKAGSDPLDIKTQELVVEQRQNALIDAERTFAKYTIRTPLAGIVAKLNVRVGDPVSSGTVAATLVTQQQIATITLNEVDVVKIKVGEKATLTFDAIEGLTITGSVVAIDTIGATSQGVVSYAVKIGLDVQDDRVKPGMSVSVAIITNVRQDVLLVPNGAVKIQGQGFYVEVLQNGQPVRRAVLVGLSNDTVTEVMSGLEVGDNAVTQTIAAANTVTPSTSQGLGGIRIPGLGGGIRGAGGR